MAAITANAAGPIIVDLGCGDAPRGTVGLDIAPGPRVDIVCAAGFEPLPFADGSVTMFLAWDFLEHLPVSLWRQDRPGAPTVQRPRIALLRDIYRCLRPGGAFVSHTPTLAPAWAQDPTHEAPPWVPETWRYFCGEVPEAARYGIDFAFELMRCRVDGAHLDVTVRKPPG